MAGLASAIIMLPPALALAVEDRQAAAVLASERPKGWRLKGETSPYLRAHVDDLVAWRPWGEAAFREARKKGRPVFLSIGYASCYWCHVLQREVFRDPDLAALINRHFIPVLVDRERRPEVDAYFQAVSRLIAGRAGWPVTVLLTPDLLPVLAFGYVPPSRFRRNLQQFVERWQADSETLRGEGQRIAAAIRRKLTGDTGMAAHLPDDTALARAAGKLAGMFDPFHGGLMTGAKHFRVPVLDFLLDQGLRNAPVAARAPAVLTLRTVMRAGVMDHLDGGFFRYATDPFWNVPHYEKMISDQAQLADLFLRAWLATGETVFMQVARRTLDYALADLQAPLGAFFTARDALSEGEEGGFYLFSPQALAQILGKDDAAFLVRVSGGVILQGTAAGRLIPNISEATDAEEVNRAQALFVRLSAWRARHRRPPARDEKIVAAYNGLMIHALARAGMWLGDARYREQAMRAARFVLSRMLDADGRLFRVFHDGRADTPGRLSDYAHMIRGLLALFDATADTEWLTSARTLAKEMRKRFILPDGRLAETNPRLDDIHPVRDLAIWQDTALPSAQSVAAEALLDLWNRTGEDDWRKAAQRLLARTAPAALKDPLKGAGLLRQVARLRHGPVGPLRHAGGGVVRASARLVTDRGKTGDAGTASAASLFRLSLWLKPGWHVNANPAGAAFLVPVDLAAEDARGVLPLVVRWPKPVMRRLTLAEDPLPLLEGQVAILARPAHRFSWPVWLELVVQPCSEGICLPPETLKLWPVPPSGNGQKMP